MPRIMSGTTRKVSSVSSGLRYSMTPSVPTRVSILEKIWIAELFSVELTFSISLVNRLMISPCCLLPKNGIGSWCRWVNRSVRIRYTVS
ncbi:hypothetical protein D3C85_1481980 [compost metagenome]